jgi:hypothetical protein
MESDKVIGIISDIVQSIAIIAGLVLTVKSWRAAYNHSLKAQIENHRNIIWDRAGTEIYSSMKNYNLWLIELNGLIEFFLGADPLDSRFVQRGQNWRRAILEMVGKLANNHAPYQEWKNKLEYYSPALTDIDEDIRAAVIERSEEIIEALNAIQKYEDNFESTEKSKEEIRPLIQKIGEQGVQITELAETIREYCMKKTFFLEKTI